MIKWHPLKWHFYMTRIKIISGPIPYTLLNISSQQLFIQSYMSLLTKRKDLKFFKYTLTEVKILFCSEHEKRFLLLYDRKIYKKLVQVGTCEKSMNFETLFSIHIYLTTLNRRSFSLLEQLVDVIL